MMPLYRVTLLHHWAVVVAQATRAPVPQALRMGLDVISG